MGFRLVRIPAEFAERPALAEQVEGLVELDMHLLELAPLVVAERVLGEEPLLLVVKLLDMGEDRLVPPCRRATRRLLMWV